jgi:CHAT domain-containing protein
MALDCKSRLIDGASADGGCREFVGRLARHALWLLLAASVACGRPLSGGGVERETRAIDDRLTAGDYQAALRLATDLHERASRRFGSESMDVARVEDRLVPALVKNGRGGTPEALRIAEHALGVEAAALGRDHVETTRAMHNLALVRLDRGEFNDALALLSRALEIRRRTRTDDQSLADSLDLVALSLIRLKRFDVAEKSLAEALTIREAHADAAPLALAQTLEFVALMHRRSGRVDDAGPPVERSISLRRQHAPGHPDVAAGLEILGDLRYLAGDWAGASRIWSEARSIVERSLGPDHVAVAALLNRLALAEAANGNLPQARTLREQSLSIGERWLAPCSPYSAIFVNDLAISSWEEKEYFEARRLYRKAAAILDDCLEKTGVSPNPSTRATTALNEAAIAAEMGDWAEAERLYRTAVDMWSKTLGADHAFVARGLDGLADVVASQGRFDEARRLYEQVLAMRRRTLKPAHPQIAWTLASLAAVTWKAGEPAAAARFADEAVAVFGKSGAGDEPDRYPQALELKGLLQASNGRVRDGRANLEKALSERSRIFGRTHPLVAHTQVSIAEVDFAAGANDAALAAALDAEREGRAHLLFTARYLPERVALAYAARRPRGLDLALSAALTTPDRHADVLDALIRSRGLVLDELAARAHTLRTAGRQMSAAAQRAQQARQRYANLLVRSLDESVARSLMDRARQEKEDAERVLAEESASERAEIARVAVGLDEVRRSLPAGSVLVSFAQFNRSTRRIAIDGTSNKTPSVAAFVLGAGQPGVAFIPLGTVANIEQRVLGFRREASGTRVLSGRNPENAMFEYRRVGDALRQTIWDPIAAHLREATRIFVVPDGAIGLVPLAALPVGATSYLLEHSPPISYLSAERDLAATAVSGRSGARGILALGGAAFGEASSAAAIAPAPAPALPGASAGDTRSAGDCAGVQSLQFQPLSGTVAEAQEISQLWAARQKGEPARLLLGSEASETTFKRSAHEYRVLHLATHGFFLTDACGAGAPRATRGVGALTAAAPPSRAENPLLLSGLALAGANRRASASADGDDGILTAEEVAGLDLGGVEWAVLSACDTGVGEIAAGEGVFGLRRAFQIAGARSVIMSLWSVEDLSTRAWMKALYESRFDRNRPTADAVHEASLAVLRDRRSKGLSTHPFYWAAFIAAGDWR